MNTLQLIGLTALLAFVLGYATGHHQKTVSDNAAIVHQVEKVAKIEAKNDSDVEKQDDSDKLKIAQLQADLITARAAASARRVSNLHRCVPSSQEEARASQDGGSTREPTSGDGGADQELRGYQILRDQLLTYGALTEQLRLQVQACQAQWPE